MSLYLTRPLRSLEKTRMDLLEDAFTRAEKLAEDITDELGGGVTYVRFMELKTALDDVRHDYLKPAKEALEDAQDVGAAKDVVEGR